MADTITICPFEQNPDREYIEKLSNHLFDYVMPTLSPTAWMVLCFIVRKTTGWRKESDRLSMGDIKKGTGIKSDNTVIKAVSELEERQFILSEHRKDTRQKNTYTLNTTIKIEVVTTSKNKVDDKTTSKNEVPTTSKNEVVDPKTTSKNADSKEHLKDNKKQQDASDYLGDVFNGQGQPLAPTGPNPQDQWLTYRDKALEAFPGDWGKTAKEREIKRGEILELVTDEGEAFDLGRWQEAISESIAHGVNSNNIARFKEVYRAGGYKKWSATEYPKPANGRDSPMGAQGKVTPGKVTGSLKEGFSV